MGRRLSPHYRELLPETVRQRTSGEDLAVLLDNLRPLAQAVAQIFFSTPPERLLDGSFVPEEDDQIEDRAEILAAELNISIEAARRLAEVNRDLIEARGS